MVNSVTIFGDSWATHSYKKIQHQDDQTPLSLFKPGTNLPGGEEPGELNFEKLFAKFNITINNFAKGGSSNNQILDSIKKHLLTAQNSDVILICQTDPLRDVRGIDNIDKLNQIEYCNNMNEVAEHLCRKFYEQLSEIQKQINKPFLLFAGCSKICKKYVPLNLNYITPSWTQITDNTLEVDSYYGDGHIVLIIHDFLMKKFKWNPVSAKEEFLKIQQVLDARSYLWQTNNNFGWVHPGNGAYQTMFDAIIEKIGVLNVSS
tara:strand:+ start:43 stop:825 length:783 start_codon:yes stop_codon:yes gene_type:complete